MVGEALGCEALRLRQPKPEWLKWTACAQGGSCEESELGVLAGESVYDALISRRGTPRILIRGEYHLWVVDTWGTLVDGLAFTPCRPTGMDARGDRVLSMFQMPGGSEQGLAQVDIGGDGASVAAFPFDWEPAAEPVLGNERFLYPEPLKPARLISVALQDPTDVKELGSAGLFPPFDAEDSFLYLDVTGTYQSVYYTNGSAPGTAYFNLPDENVCWAQRSYDSLVWTTCQYTPGASDRVFRTSFASPEKGTSTLLLEQSHVGWGVAAEGWYVSMGEPVAVRVDDGAVHSLESTPGRLVGVTAAHAYRYSETWKPGGGDYRYQLYRVKLP